MKYSHNISFLGFIISICVVSISAEVSITADTEEDNIDTLSDVKIEVEEDGASSVDIQELLDNDSEDYIDEGSNIVKEENIPDVDNNDQLQYTPPSTFQITAHIQTNLHTGYSYFIPKESLSTASFAHLPFLECGAVGSTTEKLPLVSGVFRHTPHNAAQLAKRDESIDVVLENLDMEEVLEEKDDGVGNTLEGLNILDEQEEEGSGINTTVSVSKESDDQHPKRPSPPKYVVALSSMEITVGGGKNRNETQQFKAGDVIFVEDTWWGVWDNEENESFDEKEDDGESDGSSSTSMKGYIMRASSESETEDMNVLMLTVPNAIHRHWKHAQYVMRRQEKEANQNPKSSSSTHTESFTRTSLDTRRPWWKMPTTFLHKHNSHYQQEQPLPQPCSLESDPAFTSKISSTTLKQHFTQHFTNILRRSTNPHPSFLPHHHQDLLLPILAQTAAGIIGGAVSLALVLQLWRVIPGPYAVAFGGVCLVGLGTWGFVWLGEEILDQFELWKERRRLERMMSEGWGS